MTSNIIISIPCYDSKAPFVHDSSYAHPSLLRLIAQRSRRPTIRYFSIRYKINNFYVRKYSTSNTNIRSASHASKFITSLLNAFNINANDIINNK